MAKKQNSRNVAKKKYSYNDRAKYHESRYRSFIDKFTFRKGVGYHTDFEALEIAEKQNPQMQYSDGLPPSVGFCFNAINSLLRYRCICFSRCT